MRTGEEAEEMLDWLKQFERTVTLILACLMALVVALATIELAYVLAKDTITPPILLLDIEELLEIFGLFMLVLIGIELLETIKAYFKENVVHVEVVLTVAMIAVARKVIILDVKDLSAMTLIGIATIVVALAFAARVFKRLHQSEDSR